jgi:hypothetical protein
VLAAAVLATAVARVRAHGVGEEGDASWCGSPRRMELLKRAIQSMRVPARATLLPQLSTRCARSPHAQAHGSGEEAEVDS